MDTLYDLQPVVGVFVLTGDVSTWPCAFTDGATDYVVGICKASSQRTQNACVLLQ